MAPSPPSRSVDITGILVLALVIALLAGAVLVWLVGDDETTIATNTTASENRDAQERPRKGQTAPDFTLVDLDGREFNLSDWRGRPVLINFWATWCGPCEVEMPAIQAAYIAHQKNDLAVLAVAVDDRVENVRRFFDKHSLTFQPLVDDGAVSRGYQVFGLPTSYFIKPDGVVTEVHTGMLTASQLEKYLKQILPQD